jgi:hypothetical protein
MDSTSSAFFSFLAETNLDAFALEVMVGNPFRPSQSVTLMGSLRLLESPFFKGYLPKFPGAR